MYCIKCAKQVSEHDILCGDCRPGSGFLETTTEEIEKKRNTGKYIGILGNIALLIGLFCSFVLIHMDAPEDYAATVFREKVRGPVKTEEAEQTEESDEEDSDKVVLEDKGYAYSIAGYLTRKTPKSDDKEDITALKKVSSYMKQENLQSLVLSDSDTMEAMKKHFGESEYEKILAVLEKYDEMDVRGVIVILLAVLSLAVSVWMFFRKDFGWAMLFSLIATIPLWVWAFKMDGISAWEYENGMYFLGFGMLAVLAGGILGNNIENCPKCRTILPGGASFCYDCGTDLKKVHKDRNFLKPLFVKWNVGLGIVGMLMMFLNLVIPTFEVGDKKKSAISIMGLRGIQQIKEDGHSSLYTWITILLVLACLLLIGAVVSSIFDKKVISVGACILSAACVILVIYLVQERVMLAAMKSFLLYPAGLLLAVFAGVSSLEYVSGGKKEEKRLAEES